MNFLIKEGNINDIKEIIEAIKYLHDIIENKEWYAIGLMEYDKILKKLEDNAIIVKALYKDELVGFLIAERHINPNSELAEEIPKDELSSSIEMDNAGVLPKYRGNHLQESLILKAESIMKERDSSIKYSYATVHPDNLPSLKTLEKVGYKKYKEKLMYGGKIRYIMRKELI